MRGVVNQARGRGVQQDPAGGNERQLVGAKHFQCLVQRNRPFAQDHRLIPGAIHQCRRDSATGCAAIQNQRNTSTELGLNTTCRRRTALPRNIGRSDRHWPRQPQQLAQRNQITARIEACAKAVPKGMKIRIHGDYHLGQVLVTRNDFVIIDFEGEPGHSLEQRRAKHSPLRDVAGMMRSFGYVQQSALRSVVHNGAEAARLAPLARAWELEVRAAFLSAYDAAARDAAARGAPARGAALYESLQPGNGILGLFELEKALYELRYEISNRPTWVGIPLQGILDWGGG